ncbi:hypothetical protein R1sor_019016 [Riccia sorocarpa]|uniref:Uncharacterized protein n=1 Tax=Riccia sorocarpa TaxID=122646 RepID=A0ABD3IEN4_9MARC
MFEAGSDVTAFTRDHMQDWIPRILEVKLQQFAIDIWLRSTPSPYGGGDSIEQEDTTQRRRSRSSHADDTQPRSRRSRRSSLNVDGDRKPQHVPLWSLSWTGLATRMGYLDIATRLAAKYGPVSIRHKNAEARVKSRREKNVMVTNPFGHQGFVGFRARFKKAFGIYPEPKHNVFFRAHGIKRVFEFMKNGRDFPEVGDPSSAEVGADDAAGADDGADGAVGAGGNDVDVDDDDAKFEEFEGNGDELEEDDHGQAPQ